MGEGGNYTVGICATKGYKGLDRRYVGIYIYMHIYI